MIWGMVQNMRVDEHDIFHALFRCWKKEMFLCPIRSNYCNQFSHTSSSHERCMTLILNMTLRIETHHRWETKHVRNRGSTFWHLGPSIKDVRSDEGGQPKVDDRGSAIYWTSRFFFFFGVCIKVWQPPPPVHRGLSRLQCILRFGRFFALTVQMSLNERGGGVFKMDDFGEEGGPKCHFLLSDFQKF